jgi:hypothetical protein
VSKANFKKWIMTADWIVWLMFGVVTIVSVLLIGAGGSEFLFNKIEHEIMTSINDTGQSIQRAREDAAKQDQRVAIEFDRVMQSSPQMISLGHQKMESIRQKMNRENINVQQK